MDERTSVRAARELKLIAEIERDPDATQIGLARKLGVAVGTVNWHLKRMVAKGYVKVKRAERRKLRYIVTPSGLALRARLTVDYIETSMLVYRQLRHAARQEICATPSEFFGARTSQDEAQTAPWLVEKHLHDIQKGGNTLNLIDADETGSLQGHQLSP